MTEAEKMLEQFNEVIKQATTKLLASAANEPEDFALIVAKQIEYMGLPRKVYAGELKRMGFKFDEPIPDCASTTLSKMSVESSKMSDDGAFTCTLIPEFAEPFKWVTAEFTINKEGEDGCKAQTKEES